jgi:hypothetical protein
MQQFTEAIFLYWNLNVSEIKKILHRNNMLPGSFNNLRLKKKILKKNPCYSQRARRTPLRGMIRKFQENGKKSWHNKSH